MTIRFATNRVNLRWLRFYTGSRTRGLGYFLRSYCKAFGVFRPSKSRASGFWDLGGLAENPHG